MTDETLRSKVEESLRGADKITPGQLQAEIERMTARTRDPEMLRELFAALHDDAFLVAEMLARPVLAEGEPVLDFGAQDSGYTIPEITGTAACANDAWRALEGPPDGRQNSAGVWTGSELIVWAGQLGSFYLADGAQYNPATDTWTPISTSGAPVARAYQLRCGPARG